MDASAPLKRTVYSAFVVGKGPIATARDTMTSFAYGVGKRRNRRGDDPHWCPFWPQYAEAAARELGLVFIQSDRGIRFQSSEQRDLAVKRAEELWRGDGS